MKKFFHMLPVMIITNIIIFVLYMLIIQFLIGFTLGFALTLMGYDEASLLEFIGKINTALVLTSLIIPTILAVVPNTRKLFFITRNA